MDGSRDRDEYVDRCREVLARYEALPADPVPVDVSEEYLRMLRTVEELPCNRSGADKSWVLRLEEAERRYFERLGRKPGA